ncbi:MAG: DUF1906 domain-containing protein [Reyranella sp.]|uniref:DUF1906 domain-containing protein n=1 Tax=Reyranella sp. TaxID=1929291 RepID=UPI001AC5D50A|nr:DUF1906 domain-containing protein [Reyranella sp.]MBN9091611.1 DUF1906 domain-containing protein [Reyranella sp.]
MYNAQYFEQVLSALAVVVVLAMFLERALSLPFEWGPLKDFLERKKLRAPLAFAVAWVICWQMKFDLLQVMGQQPPKPEGNLLSIGVILTAAVVAGGSKGAILLFQGILGFGKEAVDASVAQKTMAATLPPPGAAPAPRAAPPPLPPAMGLLPAVAPPPSPLAVAAALANGIDTSTDCTGFAACIAADGARFVCRYYRPGSTGALTTAEAQVLVGAGLAIVAVFEGAGNKIGWFSAQQGVADAQAALGHAASIGQPAGSAIYFAVDFDADPGEVGSAITSYFAAVNSTFRNGGAPYRIGVYGSGLVCSTLIGANLASLGWLSGSRGWRGYTTYARAATIVQVITAPPTLICNGQLAVDRDVGQNADIGAFSTLAALAPPPGPALATATGPWWRR